MIQEILTRAQELYPAGDGKRHSITLSGHEDEPLALAILVDDE